MGATALHDAALELLTVAVDALAGTDAGAPDRQYVSPGPPAFDCEQVTVHAGAIGDAQTAPLAPALAPAMRDATTGHVFLATLVVTAIRCTPALAGPDGSTFPAPADLQASALVTQTDAWAIWNRIVQLRNEKPCALFGRSDGRPRDLYYDGCAPVATMGGLAGWSIQLRVQLDGHRT